MDRNPGFARDLLEHIGKRGPVSVDFQILESLAQNMEEIKEWASLWGLSVESQPVKGVVIFRLRDPCIATAPFSSDDEDYWEERSEE